MRSPNVKELDINEMVIKAQTASGVLRVIYNLLEIEDYTKEDGAQDLINFLSDMGYLDEPLELRKREELK
jgi:DNA-directed RNA polymerase specialized sigma54-like protein